MSDRRKGINGGARPGAGRKTDQERLELHRLLREAWPYEQRKAALEKLAEKATSNEGISIPALKLLLAYSYGNPIERQEHTGEIAITKGYTTDASPDDWDSEAE